MRSPSELCWLLSFVLLLSSCGGGGSSPPVPPAPPPLSITTTSLPAGTVGVAYSATVEASGGTGTRTWSILAGGLPPGLSLTASTGTISGTPTIAGPFSVTVQVTDSGSPPQSATGDLSITITGLQITTTLLPDGTVNVPYTVTVARTGGMAPFTWSISTGSLPSGLSLDSATGRMSGTPSAVGTQNFTVRVDDSTIPPQNDLQALSVTIRTTGALGRNDSVSSATALSNGSFQASISPYADPIAGPANPDNDYFLFTADAGALVVVEVFAQRLSPPSRLDPILEILDNSGNRSSTCRNVGTDDGLTGAPDPTPNAFDDPCVNDDIQLGVILDSKLEFQVPATGPYFIRVLDFRGDARPDFIYDLTLSGTN